MMGYQEVWIFRHSIKAKGNDPPLTDKGRALAQKMGKTLGDPDIPTEFHASPKARTVESATELARGFKEKGGKIISSSHEKVDVQTHPRFAFHSKGEPAPGASLSLSDKYEKAYHAHGGREAFRMFIEGRHKDMDKSAEQVGGELIDFLASAYHRSNDSKASPKRDVMVTHGDSVAETLLFSLIGKNPSLVKDRGTFGYMEGFKVVMDGKKMHVEFRGKRLPVLPMWRGVLRKVNPVKQAYEIKRRVEMQTSLRKSLLRRRERDPKRANVFGRPLRKRMHK